MPPDKVGKGGPNCTKRTTTKENSHIPGRAIPGPTERTMPSIASSVTFVVHVYIYIYVCVFVRIGGGWGEGNVLYRFLVV